MEKIFIRYSLVFLFPVLLTLSCSSVKKIPENLKFNKRRHSYIRTMRLHMLRIHQVNKVKIDNNKTYEVKTYPGRKVIKVYYVGGTGQPITPYHARKGTRYYYKPQTRYIAFRALPGRCHFIQYIAHSRGPMSVWQYSHDYVSHLMPKPVRYRNISSSKKMTVSRIVRGPLYRVKRRFLNELMLQEYLREIIAGWKIAPMFRLKGNTILVNISGIGERYYDNRIGGYYRFRRAGRNRTRIVMHIKHMVMPCHHKYMKEVFLRFNLYYRKGRVKK